MREYEPEPTEPCPECNQPGLLFRLQVEHGHICDQCQAKADGYVLCHLCESTMVHKDQQPCDTCRQSESERCQKCDGTGRYLSPMRRCPACGGSGVAPDGEDRD